MEKLKEKVLEEYAKSRSDVTSWKELENDFEKFGNRSEEFFTPEDMKEVRDLTIQETTKQYEQKIKKLEKEIEKLKKENEDWNKRYCNLEHIRYGFAKQIKKLKQQLKDEKHWKKYYKSQLGLEVQKFQQLKKETKELVGQRG